MKRQRRGESVEPSITAIPLASAPGWLKRNLLGDFSVNVESVPKNSTGPGKWKIAYLLVRREWGQGYATEAASACKQYGFETMAYDKLMPLIDVHNTPSMQVVEQTGMQVDQTIIKWGMEVRI